MENEEIVSHNATAKAITNLFLFQIAMLAGSGCMSLLWKMAEAGKGGELTRGVQLIAQKKKRSYMQMSASGNP